MSRAMTLLEVLLSLALLGGISLACASWVGTAARGTEGTAERVRWRSAADATLTLVGDLIATGDFAPQEQRRPEEARVRASGAALEIDTRVDGKATTAILELANGRLVLRAGRARLLLAGVAEFEADLDEETQVLTVTLGSAGGGERARGYVLP